MRARVGYVALEIAAIIIILENILEVVCLYYTIGIQPGSEG